MSAFEELMWRGFVANSTDAGALAQQLESGPVTFYVGFDPTAPSIHFGNLVQLMLARVLQRAGHRPLILVGGSTGLIGDPRESGERTLNESTVVAQWADQIEAQVSKFVDMDGPAAAKLVNNYEWTAPMSVLTFLRDIGKHFPVNRMLDRDMVARRLQEGGISFTEFSYVLLQSLDYLELYRRHGCTLQTGGSDQWGNITAGVDLVRRATGAKVHAIATPLLTKEDGTKFGKTESGTVWLDPQMTSPYAFYQFFLNAEDSKVMEYLKIFSERSRDEIEELERATATEPFKRLAQRALADDITRLVHSEEQRAAAEAAGLAIFGRGELTELSEQTLQQIAQELRAASIPLEGTTVTDALVAGGVADSKSAARRAIGEGGAYLNNAKVSDPDGVIGDADLLAGRYVLVRRGKKNVGMVDLRGA